MLCLGMKERIYIGRDFSVISFKWTPQKETNPENGVKGGLAVLSSRSMPTIRRTSCEGSVSNVSFVSESL